MNSPSLNEAMIAWLPRLHVLENVSGAFAVSSLPSSVCPSLRELQLTGRIGDEPMAAILDAFPSLEVLRLHDGGIGQAGCEIIGAKARRLRTLEISFNPIGDNGLRALVPALEGVKDLSIHHCQISDHGFDALPEVLRDIENLNLRGTPIGRRGCAVLAEASMPNVSSLWLGGCKLDGLGAQLLAQSSNLAGLELLDYDAPRTTQPSDAAVQNAFASSPHLPAALRPVLSPPASMKGPELWRRLLSRN